MMKHRSILINLLAVMLLLLLAVGGSQAQDPEGDIGAQAAVGTAFTYQGRLNDTGGPVNGTCDFRFGLYSAASGGTPLGTDTANDVEVRDGYFSVVLNDRGEFGASAFSGEARWLGISVNCGSRDDTDLSPRQLLTSTPYALFSLNSNLLDGYDSADFLRASGGTLNGNFNVTGNVGIGTTSPQAKLHVAGQSRFDGISQFNLGTGSISMSSPGGWPGIIAYSQNGHRREMVFRDDTFQILTSASSSPSANTNGIIIRENGNVGIGTYPQQKLHVAGQSRFDGNVGIGTNPQQKFHVAGQSRFDGISQFNLGTGSISMSTPGGWPGIIAYSQNGHRREIVFKDDKLQILTSDSSAPSANNNGIIIREDGTTQVKVLQITGGSDLAEPFEIVGPENIKPGLVVAIDPEHPGQLRLADKAYDHTVAGCVSGANGIKSGLVMQQEGSAAEGTFPVALSGRVYCWADAAYAPIQPGDLLTTSDTPGHVMKATNREKSIGAVIGKAMSSLESGQGLVLVLVTLQ